MCDTGDVMVCTRNKVEDGSYRDAEVHRVEGTGHSSVGQVDSVCSDESLLGLQHISPMLLLSTKHANLNCIKLNLTGTWVSVR